MRYLISFQKIIRTKNTRNLSKNGGILKKWQFCCDIPSKSFRFERPGLSKLNMSNYVRTPNGTNGTNIGAKTVTGITGQTGVLWRVGWDEKNNRKSES